MGEYECVSLMESSPQSSIHKPRTWLLCRFLRIFSRLLAIFSCRSRISLSRTFSRSAFCRSWYCRLAMSPHTAASAADDEEDDGGHWSQADGGRVALLRSLLGDGEQSCFGCFLSSSSRASISATFFLRYTSSCLRSSRARLEWRRAGFAPGLPGWKHA